ncbi:hypothetical protein GCM10025777_53900 [Membranihabitans marinus]
MAYTQMVNLTGASVVSSHTNDKVVLKSIAVLSEEIEKRSSIQYPILDKWSNSMDETIIIGLEEDVKNLPKNLQQMVASLPSIDKEGYKIAVDATTQSVAVIGADARGILYGIGKLLRNLEMRKGEILIADDFSISSSPTYPIRGHQLGYRPKTNAYDAWSPEQYDDYIRDLAIFGANSIEIMPPQTDDDFQSVHMKLPSMDMIVKQSEICDSYGLDVWMWFPNLGSDYEDPVAVQKELEERHKIFQSLPRLDALFVPGGDPGHLEPNELFDFLKKEAEVLHKSHPKAKIWVSPQSSKPTKQWFEDFYSHVNKKYDWFGGVVFGPWVKTPLSEIKKIIGPDVAIRRYPDITHTVKCQYPIPNWDLSLANTLDREPINPSPIDQKIIHNSLAKYADGSISYSEGINDDVNKMIWSDQDWDPETPVSETLTEYGRYFISPDLDEEIAQGLLGLEANMKGSLLGNDGVLRTLQQWQSIEATATAEVLSNYRFQLALIRAYFDAYQYRRLMYETELEQAARDILLSAPKIGSIKAIEMASETLAKSRKTPIQPEWKQRCYALADSLFNNIGAQLTVESHGGVKGRGTFIDNIDIPLNDVLYLLDQFLEIKKLNSEEDRLAAIHTILHRTDPGPGGFYDNFGSPRSLSKVISEVSWEEDPGTLISPRVSFGVGLNGEKWKRKVKSMGFEGNPWPLAWMNHVTTLYQQPLEIEYDHLDSKSKYSIRIAYTGRFRAIMKLEADGILVHDYLKTGSQPIYEFDLPMEAVRDGKVRFKWTCSEGQRGSQVSEIWLIKE